MLSLAKLLHSESYWNDIDPGQLLTCTALPDAYSSRVVPMVYKKKTQALIAYLEFYYAVGRKQQAADSNIYCLGINFMLPMINFDPPFI